MECRARRHRRVLELIAWLLTSEVVQLALCSFAVAAPPERMAAEPIDARYRKKADEMMIQADVHRVAGAHAEAARAFMVAYEALSRRSRPDVKEKQAISLAVDEFRLAQEVEPDDLLLLQDELILLERYHERMGGVTSELAKEFERVKGRIEALSTEEAERRREAEVGATEETEAEAMEGTKEESKPKHVEKGEIDVLDHRPRRQAAALVAAGVVSIMGGSTLMGSGMWTFGAADRRRDAQLTMLDINVYPTEDGIRENLDQWHRRGRGIGTGLVVSGAMLAVAGIGLTSWGILKLRRAGKGASSRADAVLPMVWPDGVGVVARVAF